MSEDITEAAIQQKCIMWFRNTYGLEHHNPQCVIFSVPNEGRDVVEQMKKKATGMLKGASDTVIVMPGKTIYCEFKDAVGRQKPEQKKFQAKIEALGHKYWLVRTVEEFIELIENELTINP